MSEDNALLLPLLLLGVAAAKQRIHEPGASFLILRRCF